MFQVWAKYKGGWESFITTCDTFVDAMNCVNKLNRINRKKTFYVKVI